MLALMPPSDANRPGVVYLGTSCRDEQLKSFRSSMRQSSAVRRAAAWDMAIRRAQAWSLNWSITTGPHVLDLGEDVLRLVFARHENDILKGLATSCKCLRGLLLPRLIEKKRRAALEVCMYY